MRPSKRFANELLRTYQIMYATLVNSSILLKILFLIIWLMFGGISFTCFDHIYSSSFSSFLMHHLPYLFKCVPTLLLCHTVLSRCSEIIVKGEVETDQEPGVLYVSKETVFLTHQKTWSRWL